MTTTTTDLTRNEIRRQRLLAEIDLISQTIERLALVISKEVVSPLYPVMTHKSLGQSYHSLMNLLERLSRETELTTY